MKVRQSRAWTLRGLAVILLGVVVLFSSSEVWAHGLGVHFSEGIGENQHSQLGLSWDTSVAMNRAFNYRLNLGYEQFKLDDKFGVEEKFEGWILENTFGFMILANENLRLWAGPQLVTGLYESDLGIGIGMSLGINLHIGESSSLGLTLGVRRSEYSGILDTSDHETIGYLRMDLFFRTTNDYFRSGR